MSFDTKIDKTPDDTYVGCYVDNGNKKKKKNMKTGYEE